MVQFIQEIIHNQSFILQVREKISCFKQLHNGFPLENEELFPYTFKRKLSEISWVADPSVLHTSVLALLFAPAEYCCVVWGLSHHTQLADVELNFATLIICGCLNYTPVSKLYMLLHIALPNLLRCHYCHVCLESCDQTKPTYYISERLVPRSQSGSNIQCQLKGLLIVRGGISLLRTPALSCQCLFWYNSSLTLGQEHH